jgi:phytoene synthase
MRILPAEERAAMYAIYAFCRAVDDIADDEGPRGPRRAALNAWREDIDLLFKGVVRPATADLAAPTLRFGLRREDYRAVIDGMAMDLEADLFAPDWETLDLYCDRVASAVGRLSVRVFGLEPEPGDALWGARCSSPTSSATSTRILSAAGSICRAKRSSAPGSRSMGIRPRIS